MSGAKMRKWVFVGLLGAVLAGCSSEKTETTASLFFDKAGQIFSGLTSPKGMPPKVTTTRAQLEAAGLTASLIVARFPTVGAESGMFFANEINGIQQWRSVDNNSFLNIRRAGVLVSSQGLGADLFGADYALLETRLEAGLAMGARQEHSRILRYVATDTTSVRAVRVFCTLTAQGPTTVEVFERLHRVNAYVEACAAQKPEADGTFLTFENRYWLGARDGIMWVSEQFLSDKVGTVRLERVFE